MFTAVEGNSVELPCNITPPIFTDRVRLVLYFRNDSAVPIYTWVSNQTEQTKQKEDANAALPNTFSVMTLAVSPMRKPGIGQKKRFWEAALFFRGDLKPARLVIDNVKGTDAGDYRCRADFYRAPTTIGHMRLDVIGMFPYSFGIYMLSQIFKKFKIFWKCLSKNSWNNWRKICIA